MPSRFPSMRKLAAPIAAIAAAWLALCPGAQGPRAAQLPEVSFVAAKFPPYTLETADGGAGPTAALLAALAQRVGQRQAALEVLPLPRALLQARNEPNTMIALVARTMRREDQFYWVCPVLDYDVAMFRRRDRPEVAAGDVAGLARWKIAGANRDVKTNYLLRQDVPVITTADEDTAVRLLLYGRVDATPAHPASIRARLRDMGEPADVIEPFLALPDLTSTLYLAFGRSTPGAVVKTYSDACQAMIAAGAVRRLLSPAAN
ncbi:MAG TPA: hypothetical protein VF194_08950 [Ferrovibrio sp.]|uniref:hypothetical protein n=1 Tax=Ferrovibrio sp. TaxID=1917215 RepID=UPI002ED141FA